jgi:hypothetical protein
VLGGKEIKVIYDDPWFWKISANRSTPRDPTSRSRPHASLPRIVDDAASSDNDEDLRTAKSSAQHRRPDKKRGPRDTPVDAVTPPTMDDGGGAWTTINYGDASSYKPLKKKRVVKKPQLQQEPGEV